MHSRNEDGANAVEFALVLPILLMLLFGGVTFGIAFNTKMQMDHGAREASRFAATLAVPGGGSPDYESWFEQVVERLSATSAGQINVADGSLHVCVSVEDDFGVAKFEADGGAASAAGFVSPSNITTGASVTHCHDTTLTGHQVQLTASRDARLDAIFFRREVNLGVHSVSVFEKGTTT